MEVLLRQDIDKLGDKDEIVTVKPGYGRNYLIPKGLGILATPSVKKMHAETLRQRSHKEAKVIEQMQALMAKITAATVKVGAKVGENGKIFGSVSNVQVADALKAMGCEVERKAIQLKGDAIKTVGKYTADVKLHREVTGSFEFEVVED